MKVDDGNMDFFLSEMVEESCAYKGPLDRAGFASWAIKGAR